MNDNEINAKRKREVIEQNIKFQPVIMVIHGQRLECLCGALAVFVNTELNEDGRIESVCVKCHNCYCEENYEE
jgi:hypothetical protein